MAHLITFLSTRFDVAREPVNPINPIAGFGPLAWLRERLLALGFQCGAIDAEDWGWYCHVSTAAGPYLVGCSADGVDGDDSDDRDTTAVEEGVEFRLQIETVRSLKDRLTGAHVMRDDDPLSRRVEQLLRDDPATARLEIDRRR